MYLFCVLYGNQFSAVNDDIENLRMHQMKQELNARIVEPHARKQELIEENQEIINANIEDIRKSHL